MPIDLTNLSIRRFHRDDFPEYQSWFKDVWLNKALGPMDEEWLEYVLKEESGAQYSIKNEASLLAVIGVVWAKDESSENTISDLAVHPAYRRQGVGQASIHLLLKHLEARATQRWVSWVDKNNPGAKHFLIRMGWQLEQEKEEEDMHLLSWPKR